MSELTLYERKAHSEIEAWKNGKDSAVTRALNLAGRPVGWVFDRAIPSAVNEAVSRAVMGFLAMMKDLTNWTYSKRGIVEKAKACGIEVGDCRELRDCDLEKLDRLARTYFAENKIIAALEGAGCGLGGLALFLADIPILLGVCLRTIQQIGTCYGFDMENPEMEPVIMSIFGAGSIASGAAKAAALTDMRMAAVALGKNWTYRKVAEQTQTGVILKFLKERANRLPQEIAQHITKRKLSQILPIVGVAIGAGFNYQYVNDIAHSAYMIFRDMHLTAKYAANPHQVARVNIG